MSKLVQDQIDKALGALTKIKETPPNLGDFEAAKALATLTNANKELAQILPLFGASEENPRLIAFATSLYEQKVFNRIGKPELSVGEIVLGLKKLSSLMGDKELGLSEFKKALQDSGLVIVDQTIRKNFSLNNLYGNLEKAGYITRRNENGRPFYRLTDNLLEISNKTSSS
jgi:hypothetical protein